MFYQITIDRKDPKTIGIRALNLSRESLEHRVLVPYRQGSPITLSGTTVQCSEIGRVQIMETEEKTGNLDDVGKLALQLDGYTHSRSERDLTDDFITGPPGTDSQAISQATQQSQPSTATRTVFVVHGRNEEARKAIFAFLRSIGLDPLEWSRAVQSTGKATPYIGEILDAASRAPTRNCRPLHSRR